jgi:hypothetical protein
LYGSIDAAKVRLEPRPKKGEEKKRHEDWRDMKVPCWFETEIVPPAQQRKRHQAKMQREQPALRAKSKQYFCELERGQSFTAVSKTVKSTIAMVSTLDTEYREIA